MKVTVNDLNRRMSEVGVKFHVERWYGRNRFGQTKKSVGGYVLRQNDSLLSIGCEPTLERLLAKIILPQFGFLMMESLAVINE